MDLIGPIDEPHGAAIRPHAGERELLADAASAVGLDGHVDDLEGHVGDKDFGLCDLDEGVLGVDLVDLGCGVEDEEARGVDFDPAVRDALEGRALAAERLAKGRPLRVVGARDEIL
jgi:hypothetical protein